MSRAIFLSVVVVPLATNSALAQPAPSVPAGHQIGEESAVLAALVTHGPGTRANRHGVDVFDLVKIDGEWRVSNSMWTVEPDACAELRPADASQLRPED